MSENITHINEGNFDNEVLKSDLPVLVDFYANWCGPCKTIAPFLDNMAKDFKDKVRIAKIDVDSNRNIAQKYNIRGIPTMILFKNGNQKDIIVGADPIQIKQILSEA